MGQPEIAKTGLTSESSLTESPINSAADAVLNVSDLRVYYDTPEGVVKAVDGVSFSLRRGERLALVGESGCGKTTLAMALMRLTKQPGYIAGGAVWLDGIELMGLTEEEMRQNRLSKIALIPQGAMNSLNPVMRVEGQIIDGMTAHGIDDNKRELINRVSELLFNVPLHGDKFQVRFFRPEDAGNYPHQRLLHKI